MKGARRTRKRPETGFADLMTPPSPSSGVITGLSRTSPRATEASEPISSAVKDDWKDLLTAEPKRKMSPRQPIIPGRTTEGNWGTDFRLEEREQSATHQPQETSAGTTASVPAFLSGWEGADGWGDDPDLDDSDPDIDEDAWGVWPEAELEKGEEGDDPGRVDEKAEDAFRDISTIGEAKSTEDTPSKPEIIETEVEAEREQKEACGSETGFEKGEHLQSTPVADTDAQPVGVRATETALETTEPDLQVDGHSSVRSPLSGSESQPAEFAQEVTESSVSGSQQQAPASFLGFDQTPTQFDQSQLQESFETGTEQVPSSEGAVNVQLQSDSKGEAQGGFAPFDENAFESAQQSSDAQADPWGAWDDVEVPQATELDVNSEQAAQVEFSVEPHQDGFQVSTEASNEPLRVSSDVVTENSTALVNDEAEFGKIAERNDAAVESQHFPAESFAEPETVSQPPPEVTVTDSTPEEQQFAVHTSVSAEADSVANIPSAAVSDEVDSSKASQIPDHVHQEDGATASEREQPVEQQVETAFDAWGFGGEAMDAPEADGWGWEDPTQNGEDPFAFATGQTDQSASAAPESHTFMASSSAPDAEVSKPQHSIAPSPEDEGLAGGDNNGAAEVVRVPTNENVTETAPDLEADTSQSESVPEEATTLVASQSVEHGSFDTAANFSRAETSALQSGEPVGNHVGDVAEDISEQAAANGNAFQPVFSGTSDDATPWGQADNESMEGGMTMEEGWGLEIRSTDVDVSSTIAGTDVPSVAAPSSVDGSDFDAEQQNSAWDPAPMAHVSAGEVQNGDGEGHFAGAFHNTAATQHDSLNAFGVESHSLASSHRINNPALNESIPTGYAMNSPSEAENARIQSNEEAALSSRTEGVDGDFQKRDSRIADSRPEEQTQMGWGTSNMGDGKEMRTEKSDFAGPDAVQAPNASTAFALPSEDQYVISEPSQQPVTSGTEEHTAVQTNSAQGREAIDSPLHAEVYSTEAVDGGISKHSTETATPLGEPSDHVSSYWQQKLESTTKPSQGEGTTEDQQSHQGQGNFWEHSTEADTTQTLDASSQMQYQQDSTQFDWHNVATENQAQDAWGASWGGEKDTTENSTYDPFAPTVPQERSGEKDLEDAFYVPDSLQSQSSSAQWFPGPTPSNSIADIDAHRRHAENSIGGFEKSVADPTAMAVSISEDRQTDDQTVQQPYGVTGRHAEEMEDQSSGTSRKEALQQDLQPALDDSTAQTAAQVHQGSPANLEEVSDFSMYAPKQRPTSTALQDPSLSNSSTEQGDAYDSLREEQDQVLVEADQLRRGPPAMQSPGMPEQTVLEDQKIEPTAETDRALSFTIAEQPPSQSDDAYDPFAPTEPEVGADMGGATEFGWGDFEVPSSFAPTSDAQQKAEGSVSHELQNEDAPENQEQGSSHHMELPRHEPQHPGTTMPMPQHISEVSGIEYEQPVPDYSLSTMTAENEQNLQPPNSRQVEQQVKTLRPTDLRQFGTERSTPITSTDLGTDQDVEGKAMQDSEFLGASEGGNETHATTSELFSESTSHSAFTPFPPQPEENMYAPARTVPENDSPYIEPPQPQLSMGEVVTPSASQEMETNAIDMYKPRTTKVTNDQEANANPANLQDPSEMYNKVPLQGYPEPNKRSMEDVWNYSAMDSGVYEANERTSQPSSELVYQEHDPDAEGKEDVHAQNRVTIGQAEVPQFYTAPPSTHEYQDPMTVPPPMSEPYPIPPEKTSAENIVADTYAPSDPYAYASHDLSSSVAMDTQIYSYPYSIMDAGASNELDHRPPRPVLSWGFGGTLLAVFPSSQNSNFGNDGNAPGGSSSQVHVYSLSEVSQDGTDDDWTAASEAVTPPQFPVKPRDLSQYAEMCERLSKSSAGLKGSHAEGRAALWRVLSLMCNRPISDWRDQASSAITGPVSVPMFGRSGSASYLSGRTYKDSPMQYNQLKPKGEEEQMAAASEVERLISAGKGREAIQIAQDAGLWSLALVLAPAVDRGMYLNIVSNYARTHLSDGSALQTLFFSMAEDDEEIIRRATSPSGLSEWRKTVSMLLAGRRSTLGHNQHGGTRFLKLVERVGDALIEEKKDVVAGHICYLVSGRISSLDLSHIPLIGADSKLACGRPRSVGSPSVVLQSLTYEAIVNTVKGETFPHLLPFRLLLAQEIAAVGRPDVALSHCEAISNAVRSVFDSGRGDVAAKFFTPPFLASLESLEGRLRGHMGAAQSEEKIGKLSALGRSLSSVLRRSASDLKEKASAPGHRKQPSLSSVGSTPPLEPLSLTQSVGQPQVADYPQRQLPPTLQQDTATSQPIQPSWQRDAISTPNLIPDSQPKLDSQNDAEDSSNKRWNSFVAKTVGMLAPADGDLSPPPRHRTDAPSFMHPQGDPRMGLGPGIGSRAPGQAMETMHMRSASMGDVPNAMLHSVGANTSGPPNPTNPFPSPSERTQYQLNGPSPSEPNAASSSTSDRVHMRTPSDMTQASQTSERKPPRPPRRSSTASSAASMSALEAMKEQRPQAARGWRARISERIKAAFGGPPRAHMGSENKFVYDKERGRWIIEGEDPDDEDDAVPPPPEDDDAAFGNEAHEVSSSTSYENLRASNIGTLPRSHSMQDSQSPEFLSQSPMDVGRASSFHTPETLAAPVRAMPERFRSFDSASESSATSSTSVATPFSATPPRHPGPGTANKFRAGKRTGRKAYVDTFNKGNTGGPAVPPPGRPGTVMPGGFGSSAGAYRIFTPSPAQSSTTEEQDNYGSGVGMETQNQSDANEQAQQVPSENFSTPPPMTSTGAPTQSSTRQPNFQSRRGPRMMA